MKSGSKSAEGEASGCTFVPQMLEDTRKTTSNYLGV